MMDFPRYPWIVCSRGHEIRVFPHGDDCLLQVRVDGEQTTTTILGPQAQLMLVDQIERTSDIVDTR